MLQSLFKELTSAKENAVIYNVRLDVRLDVRHESIVFYNVRLDVRLQTYVFCNVLQCPPAHPPTAL